jgi:FkbM family methyltransferase
MIKFWEYFVKILHKTKVCKYFNFYVWIKLYGYSIKIPIIGQIGLFNLVMDEYWISDIYNIVKDDYNTCLDLGANIGQTLIKLKAINPLCHYVGVEPNPNCLYYLYELIKANDFKNCQIVPAAIADGQKLDKLHFLYDEKADRSATIFPYKTDQVIDSKMVNFISYINLWDIVRDQRLFIKIDIEKSEHLILNHALKNSKHLVLLEVLPGIGDEDIARINLCNEYIKRNQFQIYRVLKNKEHFVGLQRMEKFPFEGKIEESDFLLIHENHCERFNKYIGI